MNPPMSASNPQATCPAQPRTHLSPITLRSPLHEPFLLRVDSRTNPMGCAVWSNVTRRTGGPQDWDGGRGEGARPFPLPRCSAFQHFSYFCSPVVLRDASVRCRASPVTLRPVLRG